MIRQPSVLGEFWKLGLLLVENSEVLRVVEVLAFGRVSVVDTVLEILLYLATDNFHCGVHQMVLLRECLGQDNQR